MLVDNYADKLHKIVSYVVASSGLSYQQVAVKAQVPISELIGTLRGDYAERHTVYQKVLEGMGYDFNEVNTVIRFMGKHTDTVRFIMKLQEVDELITKAIPSAPSQPEAPQESVSTEVVQSPQASRVVIMERPVQPRRNTKTEKMIQEYVGRHLRRFRDSKRWAQTQLARKMDIHQSTVSGLERGIYSLRDSDTFHQAFASIGMDLDALIKEAEQKFTGAVEYDYEENEVYNMVRRMKNDDDLYFFEVEFRENMAKAILRGRMMKGMTTMEIADKCKTNIDTIEKMENGDYPLPEDGNQYAVWRRVTDFYGIPFMDELYDWLKDKLSHVI